MPIWIITTNYDWEESIEAFRSREEAVAKIAEIFECEETPDTPDFWQEVQSNYDAGKWKGFQFVMLDPATLAITDIAATL